MPQASHAPRYDTPRGGAPRTSAALSPRPAGDPVAQANMAQGAPVLTLATFEDVVALAATRRDIAVKTALERDVRLVRCEDGKLELALEPSARRTLINDLSRKLSEWTGKRWMVVVSAETGAPTLKKQSEARDAELKHGVRADPLVQSVLSRFPGAEIVGVTQHDGGLPPAGDAADDSEAD
jgi:DNA polymerase-3 subunit gamma/tau